MSVSTESRAQPLIVKVLGGSPAQRAGFQPGELVATIDGQPVNSASALSYLLAREHPGKLVTVTLSTPGGSQVTKHLTLARAPARRPSTSASYETTVTL